ncbi:MAG: hypothetical protein EAZ77_01125 [Nostocales cyanobacterium]|nr:MAG: hypothetical protein EAZ77_01125 [Nostocales cyanobacterium]
MTRIRDIVQTALATGYLTLQAENQLRELLSTRYDCEDFNAFMTLQEAAMMGQVKQESRESRQQCGLKRIVGGRI